MKIVTYNVNGIRAALRKGFADWVAANDFSIICIQETKAHPEQVDLTPLEEMGYHAHWHSATRRKGYSGVLTLSRQAPDLVETGCGQEIYDCEGRILRTDFGGLTLLNCYFPSGTSGQERQDLKMEFLADFVRFVSKLRAAGRERILVVGDYNIAHAEIDIHDPKRNQKTTGFLPEERAWMSEWLGTHGFTDAFRHLNPELVQYSWWSTRANARANNKGWRIDYQSLTTADAGLLLGAYQEVDAVHSDHCPVVVQYGEELVR